MCCTTNILHTTLQPLMSPKFASVVSLLWSSSAPIGIQLLQGILQYLQLHSAQCMQIYRHQLERHSPGRYCPVSKPHVSKSQIVAPCKVGCCTQVDNGLQVLKLLQRHCYLIIPCAIILKTTSEKNLRNQHIEGEVCNASHHLKNLQEHNFIFVMSSRDHVKTTTFLNQQLQGSQHGSRSNALIKVQNFCITAYNRAI